MNFDFSSNWKGTLQIKLIDIEGKFLFEKIVEKQNESLFETINVDKLSPGIYYLSISNGELMNTLDFNK